MRQHEPASGPAADRSLDNRMDRRTAEETIKVPQMAESISEGTLKTWLKKEGDYVQADEEIASIETDKVGEMGMPGQRQGQTRNSRQSILKNNHACTD